jgi:ATP-dependent DNA helicase DinG
MEVPKLVVLPGGKLDEPSGDYIHQVFGAGGYLAAQVAGYQPRPGQIKLARAIDHGIRTGHHVIGEGPTGTGKSLAYSVPAVYHAMFSGKRICIVTANKNLQRQIYQKDLADLAKAVPWKFKYAIRKGHSSYLCLRNHEAREWRELLFEDSKLAEIVNDTAEWADDTETGDFEDSPGPPPKVWSAFSTSREDCDGRKCRQFEECFAKLARDRAQSAHVLVTNYHLFFLHLKFGLESKILPNFDVVILDEAHNAANIAREFFGQEVTWGQIYRCIKGLHTIDVTAFKLPGQRMRDAVMEDVGKLWAELGGRARARKHILKQDHPIPSEALEERLKEAAALYHQVAEALAPIGEATIVSKARASEAATYAKLAAKCTEKAAALGEFRVVANEHTTYFIEGSGNEDKGKFVKLKSKAIEVGSAMRHLLFERYKTVVQTSATLAVRGGAGGDFAYLRREMGMGKMGELADLDIEELVVASPFDWPQQAMLVIPRTMPTFQTGSEIWDQAVCDHLEQTVNMVEGRTLGLFTSFRMLQKAAAHLRATTSWRVLVQGEATNRELAAQFQADVGSVLLGTESFSEGVSIEGEACTCVVLDKIPFLNADDPVIQAIEARHKARGGRENVFQTHMLPEAIISFKQRVGRLIRTVTDVGVVVVLDKRLITKPYRTQFLKSIPPLRTEESLSAIEPFLRSRGALA